MSPHSTTLLELEHGDVGNSRRLNSWRRATNAINPRPRRLFSARAVHKQTSRSRPPSTTPKKLARALQDRSSRAYSPCMKQNLTVNQGTNHSTNLRRTLSVLVLTLGFAATVSAEMGGNRRYREALERGDILYVDSGNAVDGGGLFRMNPRTGERSVVSMGGLLRMPFGVTVDARTGLVVVSDSGRLVAVDPMTGKQAVVADNSTGMLGMPFGMDFDLRGNLAVANAQAVVRMDARQESLQVVAAGGSMQCPVAVAAGRNNDLFVANMGSPSEILRVDARTGEQTVIARGGLLNRPQAIAVSGADIYVTDVASSDGNLGLGRVIHINATTGEQSVVSEGELLVGPMGIAVEADGQLIVCDPYTINPESPDLFDGAVMRIDPATGEQTMLARGVDGFVNPCGVAIVPEMSRAEANPTRR